MLNGILPFCGSCNGQGLPAVPRRTRKPGFACRQMLVLPELVARQGIPFVTWMGATAYRVTVSDIE